MIELTLTNVEKLVKKYGALQDADEVVELIKYFKTRPFKIFLEIGVYNGGLSAVLKTFFPDLEIIGVDYIDPDNPVVAMPGMIDVCRLLKKNIKEFNINYINGTTQSETTIKRVEDALKKRTADFVFIDASHDYDSVKHDFETYGHYSKIVGFHDLHNAIGPWLVWKEIKDKFDTWEFRPGNGLGIGMLNYEKPSSNTTDTR
ncbi:MAG: class I SAM-dependent methyltransferase [Bacteroidetes bacterium]|nr:class I SAM-dependent methyltransferase [Bacteroidota bacterium]